MADNLQFFDVEQGLGIDENVNIIAVSSPPGGSAPATTVPRGSFAMDYNSTPAKIYWKFADGSGTDKWKEVADANAVLAEISWREPVKAHNSVLAGAIPTPGPGNDTQDGVTITTGDRVLFSNVATAGDRNVWIYDAVTGTYTEDANAESIGDRLYVFDGNTWAGTIWTFNKNSQWVLSEKATDEVELSYIRDYVGKSTLGDLKATEPIYGSNNYVTDTSQTGDDLAAAIGVLDAGLGPKVPAGTYNAISPSTVNDINDNIEALDAYVGQIGGQVSLPSATGNNRLLDSVSVYDAAVVRWIVFAFDGTTVRSWTVTATHDGQPPSTQANNTDRAVRARLRLNTPFADTVSVSVTLDATPGTDLELRVSNGTNAVAWRAARSIVAW